MQFCCCTYTENRKQGGISTKQYFLDKANSTWKTLFVCYGRHELCQLSWEGKRTPGFAWRVVLRMGAERI